MKNKEGKNTSFLKLFKQKNTVVTQQLYQNNYYKTEQYILKNSGTVSEAKDIFQEAFIITWETITVEKFIPNSVQELEAYLFQVAKYKWMDQLKQKKHTTHYKNLVYTNSKIVTESIETYNYETDTQLKQLEKCLISFKDPCKTILKKFYFEKLNYHAIADILNYNETTLKTMKYRCLKKLKKMMLQQ